MSDPGAGPSGLQTSRPSSRSRSTYLKDEQIYAMLDDSDMEDDFQIPHEEDDSGSSSSDEDETVVRPTTTARSMMETTDATPVDKFGWRAVNPNTLNLYIF